MRKSLLLKVALACLCGCTPAVPPLTPTSEVSPPPQASATPVGSATPQPSASPSATPSAAPSAGAATPGPAAEAPQYRFDKGKREDMPVRLTASDGTGLELVSYQAQTVINGPLAFTELHLAFKNPQDRTLEGRFEIVLPERAALSRLAMKTGQNWQEAEVVELQKARRAYEDFLHRRQDPALMEKQAGNQFQARVFPIPAKGEKELILSYSQELTSDQDYRLPLAGLPKVGHLSIDASVWTGADRPEQKLHFTLQGQAPDGDLAIVRTSPVKALVHGDLALLSLTPRGPDETVVLQDILVLVDTSASRSAGYRAQLDKLEQVLKALAATRPPTQGSSTAPKGPRVQIAAFDQAVTPVFTGPISECRRGLDKLRQRRPLGATDLGQALRWAGKQKGYPRLLLVTDGVTTSGETALATVGGEVERADVIVVGGIRETQALEDLVFHQNKSSGLVLDGEKSASELSRSLLRRPLSGVKVAVAGAEWVWPEVLDGVEPGQERLVYAQVKKGKQELEVTLSGPIQQDLKLPVTSVSWPLLQRAAVAAQIGRLLQQRKSAKGKDADELAQQIVALSTHNRVVCDLTALLVLETDADYARFNIDRKALTDILAVGPHGLELRHRQPVVAQAPPATPPPPVVNKAPRDPFSQGANHNAPAMSRAVAAAGGESVVVDDAPPAVDALPSSAPQSELRATVPPPPPGPAPRPSAPLRTESPGRQQRQEVYLPRSGSPAQPRRVASPAYRDRATRTASRASSQYENQGSPALSGQLLSVEQKIGAGRRDLAMKEALEWQAKQPGDVLALVALGEAYEARGQKQEAARAYGSIVDLYPGRADLRRFAGVRLEALGREGDVLAADTFAKALEQRPDHPSSYRMRAYALVRLGRLEEAFEVLERGTQQHFPSGRFLGCDQILREDLGLVGAAWAAKEPSQRGEIVKRVNAAGAHWEDAPSLRFVLNWETDANDVDFHIKDSQGGHAFFSSPGLPSGGRLYADVTTGYGPECFNIPGKARAGPYKIFIHYYSRGPMGYGMGSVEIVRHDGKGHLRLEQRPYVVMNDHAYVDLGIVTTP